MKQKIIFLCFIFIQCILAYSIGQVPFAWQKCYGGSWDEEIADIKQTSDGGYILVGSTNSTDGEVTGDHDSTDDYWVVKIDTLGAIQWGKCYGGTRMDIGSSVQPMVDGGYLVSGYTYSNDGDVSGNHDTTGNTADFWVIKLDSAGNLKWQKCYGGIYSDLALALAPANDGGFVIGGFTLSRDGDVTCNTGVADSLETAWIIKIDSGGNIEWQQCWNSIWGDAEIYSVKQTKDNGFIAAGFAVYQAGVVVNPGDSSDGNADYLIIKLDSAGNTQWLKVYGGSNADVAYSVQQTNDDGYVVAGYTESNDKYVSGNHSAVDYWVIKLDSNGGFMWQKCYGGSQGDEAMCIIQTTDSGYLVTGATNSNDGQVTGYFGNEDGWLVKTDNLGNLLWERCFGGSNTDDIVSIIPASDNGYMAVGITASDDGEVSGNHGAYDYWVFKLGDSSLTGLVNNTAAIFLSIFPNPTNNLLSVNASKLPLGHFYNIEICNVIGQIVLKQSLPISISTFPCANWQAGLYIWQVTDESGYKVAVGKVVKE